MRARELGEVRAAKDAVDALSGQLSALDFTYRCVVVYCGVVCACACACGGGLCLCACSVRFRDVVGVWIVWVSECGERGWWLA